MWSRRVCWPEKIRLRPASCAALLKLVNERVTPGSAGEVSEKCWSSRLRERAREPDAEQGKRELDGQRLDRGDRDGGRAA